MDEIKFGALDKLTTLLAVTSIVYTNISPEEKLVAELSRMFEESSDVVDLRKQLEQGLITVVEFSNKTLHEWAKYKVKMAHVVSSM